MQNNGEQACLWRAGANSSTVVPDYPYAGYICYLKKDDATTTAPTQLVKLTEAPATKEMRTQGALPGCYAKNWKSAAARSDRFVTCSYNS